VLANEGPFLQTVHGAIDLLRIAHEKIMTAKEPSVREYWRTSQVLINAVTGDVGTKTDLSDYPTYQEVSRFPCTLLRAKRMSEKLFMVYLNGARDPTDLAYRQSVRASRVEVTEDCLSFFKADGTLSAFFDLAAVRTWHEIDESELLPN
jgi:hypothetical protein